MPSNELYHKVRERMFPNKWIQGHFLIFLFRVNRMFLTRLAFNHVRRLGGSAPGAILTHAGFNFGMGFPNFYALHSNETLWL